MKKVKGFAATGSKGYSRQRTGGNYRPPLTAFMSMACRDFRERGREAVMLNWRYG
ncbi:MAG: hypothetical protein LBF78_00045 [Treponema sp.]|nr:hypothetical protein [Treponema sp.]